MLGSRHLRDLDTVKTEFQCLKIHPNQTIDICELDLAEETSINAFSQHALNHFNQRIDILVNNAGIHGPLGLFEENNWEDWTHTIKVNFLGTVCLTRQFLRIFKKNHSGKIIVISGGGATEGLPNMSAYAASKVALLRWMEGIALELKPFNIQLNAIAPGVLITDLTKSLLSAGPTAISHNLYHKIHETEKSGIDSLEKASSLAVYLASEISDKITGKLIAAVWDPWTELNHYADQLSDSDVYTLRRILPEDRALDLKKEC